MGVSWGSSNRPVEGLPLVVAGMVRERRKYRILRVTCKPGGGMPARRGKLSFQLEEQTLSVWVCGKK